MFAKKLILIDYVYQIQKHLKDIRIQRFREIIDDHESNRYVFHLNSMLLNCLTNSMSLVDNMLRAFMMFRVFEQCYCFLIVRIDQIRF